MRAVGLFYALHINDGSVFAVIMLDMLGRACEIIAALRANWHQRLQDGEPMPLSATLDSLGG